MKKRVICTFLLIGILLLSVACNKQNPDVIGEEKAIEIALEKAELSQKDVFMKRTELDRDNGIWKYEVEFIKDGIEYSADIKAEDGTILSWEIDTND
ncbi:MAG: PepSY domain-containing protein [Clostridia bacterium]|nr:PepSY domain-containing protein [Clostridia bacterium]